MAFSGSYSVDSVTFSGAVEGFSELVLLTLVVFAGTSTG